MSLRSRPARPGQVAPSTKLKPRRYYVNERCSANCSLSKYRLPGDMPEKVHSWYEAGHNNDKIIELAAQFDVKLSNGAIGRHKKNHLELVADVPDLSDEELALAKVNHVELLEQIIARGAQNIHRAKITPELALKAVDMVYKLTQGSQMADFMDAVTAAMAPAADDDDEYLTPTEAAEASMASEEQAQGDVISA